MSGRLVRIAAIAAVATSLAAVAHAAPDQNNDFAPQPNRIGPPAPHRTLQWDSRTGRWGLSLDVNQPVDREPNWGDASVGVTYRVSPGVHTGVGFTLAPESTPDGRHLEQGQAPRVRLQTTFKF